MGPNLWERVVFAVCLYRPAHQAVSYIRVASKARMGVVTLARLLVRDQPLKAFFCVHVQLLPLRGQIVSTAERLLKRRVWVGVGGGGFCV